jgi:hypothetical protein
MLRRTFAAVEGDPRRVSGSSEFDRIRSHATLPEVPMRATSLLSLGCLAALLASCGGDIICANSPQAKGRVERMTKPFKIGW